MKTIQTVTASISLIFLSFLPAAAIETPIGLPQTNSGMEIAAVYLQPIEMEPASGPHAMSPRKGSDIHIEADISADENNPNGFATGEWIPYLSIGYTLINLSTNEKIEGMMMPMIANDGPHYGDNVKMPGLGKYKLVLNIVNPMANGFGRHTDRETGVGPWFEPFQLEWTFNFLGAGKKGGY
ncbi:MAG: iron transporter [Deltaproteobacteria bacterium]|nr:iron transporter [Deltaproteobacteria bacterium]